MRKTSILFFVICILCTVSAWSAHEKYLADLNLIQSEVGKMLFTKASQYYQNRNFVPARENCDKLLQLYPDNNAVLLTHAMIYSDSGCYMEARSDVDKILAADPNYDPLVLYIKAISEQSLQNFTEGIEWALRYIDAEQKPKSRIYSSLGVSYCATRQYEDAIKAFDTALSLGNLRENTSDTYCYRSVAYAALGNYGAAIEDANAAIGCASKPDFYILRGRLYLHEKMFRLALDDCDFLIREYPDDAEGYLLKGMVHSVQEEYKEAVAAYSSAIERSPDFSLAYSMRGMAYMFMNKNRTALQDLNKGVKLPGDRSVAYKIRGVFYMKNKKTEKAIKDFERCLELTPEDREVAYFLFVARTMGDDVDVDLSSDFFDIGFYAQW